MTASFNTPFRTMFRDGRPHWLEEDHGHTSPCWVWQGGFACEARNYSRITVRKDGKRHNVPAHQWYYEHYVGPVGEGLELDHLCRNPRCINPSHLEPVTHLENIRRAHAALTDEQEEDLRTFFAAHLAIRRARGFKHVEHGFRLRLAERYGIAVPTLKNIARGRPNRVNEA